MFEPESAASISVNHAFADTVEKKSNESRERNSDSQSLISPTKGMAESASENSAPTLGSVVIGQPKQSELESPMLASNPPAESRIDLMNEQIQALLKRLNTKQRRVEPFSEPKTWIGPSNPEASAQTFVNPGANEPGLSARIEETPRRLNSQANHPEQGQTEFEDRRSLGSRSGIGTGLEASATLSGQTVKEMIEPDGTPHKPIELRAEAVNPSRDNSAGTLHVPAWLADLQAQLNTRLQAAHVDIKPEPVINVTIGRVEIRAVNPERQKIAETPAKPKGVLSLDDYLKQREHKGRA
ncbi:MAG: hypothetical protein ACRER2_00745 [Methylococcales bacterium]